MAFLETFTGGLLEVIVSYSYMLVLILIVIKFLMLIMDGFGLGSAISKALGKKSEDKKEKESKPGPDGGGGDNSNPWDLDPNMMGDLKIKVTDLEGNGLPGYELWIKAQAFPKGIPWKIARRYGRWTSGVKERTGKDGYWPGEDIGTGYRSLPAGTYHIKAHDRGGNYVGETLVTLRGGDKIEVPIRVTNFRHGHSGSKRFNAKIGDMWLDDDGNLNAEGEINYG